MSHLSNLPHFPEDKVNNFSLLVLGQGPYSSSIEEYPDYVIYIYFLFLEENIYCGYSLEGLTEEEKCQFLGKYILV